MPAQLDVARTSPESTHPDDPSALLNISKTTSATFAVDTDGGSRVPSGDIRYFTSIVWRFVSAPNDV